MNTKFKKGIYIVGDLGYVMTDKQWDEVCNNTNDTDYDFGTGKVRTLSDGTIYGILGTHFGDGYFDSNVEEYFQVDSGTIGCLKVTDDEVEDILLNANKDRHIVTKVTFKNDFYIRKEKNGKLYFGELMIDTNPVACARG